MRRKNLKQWSRATVDEVLEGWRNGGRSSVECLMRLTQVASHSQVYMWREYFDAVRVVLPTVEWKPEGEEVEILGVLPVIWKGPMDFYNWADEHMGLAFSIGQYLRDFAAEADPIARDKIVSDLVASVEPQPTLSEAMKGNSNARKKDENSAGNSLAVSRKKDGGSKSPERIIARLKRDASDNPKAGELLEQISSGEIKPYKAAKVMGYVKAPDPVAIVEKQREKLEPEEQVKIWEQWGRSIPDEAMDRIGIAKEAFLNLDESSQNEFLAWANSVTGDQNGN